MFKFYFNVILIEILFHTEAGIVIKSYWRNSFEIDNDQGAMKVLIMIMFVRKAYNIEQMYLYPAVLDVYKQIENNARQYLKTLNEELVIAGDRRYDYPGFSAKYCAYLIMETKSGLIIGFKLLSKEVRYCK